MIYLDTSAFLKLYILEDGSEIVDGVVRDQSDPLPVWDLLRAELTNALRLKEFWGELSHGEADRLLASFNDRLRRGQYWAPELDQVALLAEFTKLSSHTVEIGCRTMDIFHVACALQLAPDHFVSFDKRQRLLAELAGLQVFPSTEGASGLDAD
ncbi:MAG: type II toxin-antitoxin system VapC family toxin [Spirochaetales bacterium]